MQQKPFAWSFSRASSFETCPKRYYEVDVAKHFIDAEGEALIWGSQVHNAIAAAILHKLGLPSIGKGRDRIEPAPLPASMKEYQPWVDVVCNGTDEKVFVEQQYAVDHNYKPTGWFADDVWLRAICDLLVIKGSNSHAFDWKTGKVKHDSRQLAIVAKVVFAHHPEVETCKTRFIWLKDGSVSYEVYTRDNIDRELVPILDVAKQMEQSAVTGDYQPRPSGICRGWCPVETCSYWRKGNGR